AEDEDRSLVQTLQLASGRPDMPVQELPARLLCAPALADRVRRQLGLFELTDKVEVVEQPLDDEAEDVFDAHVAHLGGRAPVALPPAADDRHLLYTEALAFAAARPWERQAEDAPLGLELKVGSEKANWLATVLGSGDTRPGLLLTPQAAGPAQLGGAEGPPAGSCALLLDAEAIPPDVDRARRHGWPEKEKLLPCMLTFDGDQPGEIDRGRSRVLALALAAVRAHLEADAATGEPTRGETTLPDGRRGRYAVGAAAAAEPAPSELRVVAGEMVADLLPDGAVIGFGSVPASAVDALSATAVWHGASPESMGGEAGLPAVILGVAAASAGPIAKRLAEAKVVGVGLARREQKEILTLICDGAVFGLTEKPADDEALTLFRRRREAAGGGHLVMVADLAGFPDPDSITGLFACVLRDAAPSARAGESRRR
ncbi:MAG TPA: hypothetical protein VGL20_01585, partial [Candidatus Dormibacteraeota bacterium]